MLNFFFEYFDLIMLVMAGIIFAASKNKIDPCLIFSNLLIFNLLNLIEFKNIGIWYYVVISVIELVFILAAYRFKSHSVILTILLATILYNAVSFIEFKTQYDFIYNHYSQFMQLSIFSLILSAVFTGVINGSANTNIRLNDSTNDSGGFSLYFRGSQ